MKIEKVQSVSEKNKQERLEAELAKAKSLIDYLSMMCDVEIPNDEEQENEIREI